MDFINSEFAKLLIILIAIFAVFFAGIKNKPQTQGNKNVHIWYICGIASFIVIGLITYIVVGNYHAENIMDYVSFASTLSSLILSILAIFITVLSNDSLGKVKDALIDLPQSVKQTVNDSVKEMRTVALEVEKIADNNANSQQGTIAKLQELLSNLESHMDKSFNETRETMLDFNNKLSDLTMTNSLKGNSSSLITQDIADKFLSGTSYLSLQLLCAWDEYKKSNISAPVSINRLLQCF